ncbi:ATP-dependent_RNA helicase [Hexamita inflata]|uniref:ATP-dependent_RNA helicase n=1 Tax=Hexamita inflata TaxID=28002 RepID=A0ABP1HLB3_9EUKA
MQEEPEVQQKETREQYQERHREFLREIQPLLPPSKKFLFQNFKTVQNGKFPDCVKQLMQIRLQMLGINQFEQFSLQIINAVLQNESVSIVCPNFSSYDVYAVIAQRILDGLKQISDSPSEYIAQFKQQAMPLVIVIVNEAELQATSNDFFRITHETGITVKQTDPTFKRVVVRKYLQMGVDILITTTDYLRVLDKQEILDYSLVNYIIAPHADLLTKQQLNQINALKGQKILISNSTNENLQETEQMLKPCHIQPLKFTGSSSQIISLKMNKENRGDFIQQFVKTGQNTRIIAKTNGACSFIKDKVLKSGSNEFIDLIQIIINKMSLKTEQCKTEATLLSTELSKQAKIELLNVFAIEQKRVLVASDEAIAQLMLPEQEIMISADLPNDFQDFYQRVNQSTKIIQLVLDEEDIVLKAKYLNYLITREQMVPKWLVDDVEREMGLDGMGTKLDQMFD